MTRALLALGSNMGNRVAWLRLAVDGLRAGGDLVAVSPVFETAPVGGPADAGAYLNAVVELDTEPDARALLARARALEAAAGRVRTVHWGPRTLDVDVVWIDGVEVDEPDLVVPHPRMWERRFVLAPLAELAPDLVGEEALAAAGGVVARLGDLDDLVAGGSR